MEFLWIIIAIAGVLAGLTISKAVLDASHPLSRKGVVAMTSLWSGLMAVFLLGPLIRIPVDVLFHSFSSWRLFGIYGYTAILAVSCFGTCLVVTLVRGGKLLLVGILRNGA